MKTNSTKTRRSIIIAELSSLSRNGWAHAKPEDYQALESELRMLDKPTPTKRRKS